MSSRSRSELLDEADERMHDLDEWRIARPVVYGTRGAHDRAHLHLVDLRELQAEPAASRPEHRVRLVQLADAVAHGIRRRLLERREELVERRIEQADRHGQPRHRLEDPLEVALLHREEPVEDRATLLLVAREDHLADDREPLLPHEHVLGPAEADALRTELARLHSVLGCVGVRQHAHAPEVVGPLEDRPEVLVDSGGHERGGPDHDATRSAVHRDHVACA